MRIVLRFIDNISRLAGTIAAPLPFLATLAICYEILMRKVFDLPTVWSSELTVMLCAITYLLGGALNIFNDAHVRVDILYTKMPPRLRAGADCLTYLFFAFYIVMMIIVIWPYMMQSINLNEHSQTAWNPAVWPLKIVLMVGFVLVLLQGTARFIRNLYHLISGRLLDPIPDTDLPAQ